MLSGNICSLLLLKNSEVWHILIQNKFWKITASYYIKPDGSLALLKGNHSLLKLVFVVIAKKRRNLEYIRQKDKSQNQTNIVFGIEDGLFPHKTISCEKQN